MVARKSRAPARRARAQEEAAPPAHAWTFLTNHTHVLLCLVAEPELPLREVAQRVGITERSVHRIVGELEAGGFLVRTREGRHNRYTIRRTLSLRHPIEAHRRVGDLIDMVLGG